MSENKKSWDVAVAEKFKERENPSPIGAVLGKILKPLPDISKNINTEIFCNFI